MSIKSLGKIAAIAAVAGLGLTACADDSVSQARQEEETCGLLNAATAKATDAMSNVRESSGPVPRASFAVESAALDIRNHSFDRSGELRTALQVQAAHYDDMAETMSDDVSQLQGGSVSDIEVDGMSADEANSVLSSYCGTVFGQQQGMGGF